MTTLDLLDSSFDRLGNETGTRSEGLVKVRSLFCSRKKRRGVIHSFRTFEYVLVCEDTGEMIAPRQRMTSLEVENRNTVLFKTFLRELDNERRPENRKKRVMKAKLKMWVRAR